MSSPQDWAIPKGSTMLVTGVNGFIGSHIADQFLQLGFKVRGTVRDVSKNIWLENLFNKKYEKDRFELCGISDMAAEGAFDGAVKGVSAVVHSASILSFDHDPNKVIPGAIAFALNALKATYAEPSAKRFVFCSSSSAAVWPAVGKPGVVVTEETWNEDAVKEAWADPPYTPERGMVVYFASKTLSEQEIWKYRDEHSAERPDLVVNSVLPDFTIGKCLDPVNQGYRSTVGTVASLYSGEVTDFHHILPPQYWVDVEDIGRLHVAAAIMEKVRNQRIFGFAGRFNWDSILDVLRKLEPDRVFPSNFSGGEDPNEIAPRDKAEQLLRDLGRPGWTTMEESLRNMVEGLRELGAGH